MWKLLRVWDYFVIVSDLTFLTFSYLVWLESNFQDLTHDSARIRRELAGYDIRDYAYTNIAFATSLPCHRKSQKI